jgi:hypothetical protein
MSNSIPPTLFVLTEEQLDLVAGGVLTGLGVGTAFSTGAQPQAQWNAGANAPPQAPPSNENPFVNVSTGQYTAGPGNPSNNLLRP